MQIIFQTINHLGLITLNRPEALNALSLTMCEELYNQLEQWENDPKIKAVIIQGNGERAFCAGGDVRQLYTMGIDRYQESQQFFFHEYLMNRKIYHFKKPYIALMHGVTMGGGLGVSIHGSHRVAAENLNLAMPETGIGFYPDIGATYFLPRCTGKTGFYLGLTGSRINAFDARFVNLIDSIVLQSSFQNIIDEISQARLNEHDHGKIVTKIIQKYEVKTKESELENHINSVNHCFSKDSVEKIFEELENENSNWCQEVLQQLKQRSPTSLKVTLRALQKGATLDFDDCMKMEYTLSCHFLRNPDFYEGVRAAVVDKDRSPRWSPSRLDQITDAQVERFFKASPSCT